MIENGNIGLPMRRDEYLVDRAQNAGFTKAVYDKLGALQPPTIATPAQITINSSVTSAWQDGLKNETAYWATVIAGTFPKPKIIEEFANRRDGKTQFPVHLTAYLKSHAVTRILDVGSGPITSLGTMNAPSQVEIVAIDPLADEYNALMAKHGAKPKIATLKGQAEDLSAYADQFDIVHSRNALDHSSDPLKGLQEMLRACKPDGVVWISGYCNEAVRSQYQGLHQWNFMPVDNGDLVIWREGEGYSVRKALGSAKVTAKGSTWYTVEIRPQTP